MHVDLLSAICQSQLTPSRLCVFGSCRLTWFVPDETSITPILAVLSDTVCCAVLCCALLCCAVCVLQEAKISLVRLYQHQTYELLPGQEPLALQQNLTLSPKHGVKVRVIPRT